MAFNITPDVPPQEGEGADFGLTLQFEAAGTPLGSPDATILNFDDNLIATRTGDTVSVSAVAAAIQFESNDSPLGGNDAGTLNFGDGLVATRVGDQVNVSVPTTADAEIISGIVADGATDNSAALAATVGPGGSFLTGNKTRSKPATGGLILSETLNDWHPSVGFFPDSRGGSVLVPGDNLPATTEAINQPVVSGIGDGSGAESAFLRIVRDTPLTSVTLAWAFQMRGVNMDARGTTQVNPVHAIRIPNPNPDNNPFDPDPEYNNNKDYVAGSYGYMDVIGWPGSGLNIEAGNGRLSIDSVRFLNNGVHGIDAGGNDIVLYGHWAVGGNDGWGVKLGKTTGCYAVTGNIWSNPNTRGSSSGGAVWFQEKQYFIFAANEFNDWFRATGGDNYDSGGTVGLNIMHSHAENFYDDGLMYATSGSDGSEQSYGGVVEYTSFNIMWNHSMRSEQTGGIRGSCTADSSTDTFTSANHKLTVGERVAFFSDAVPQVLPAPLTLGTKVYVINTTTNTFQVSYTNGGSAINLTSVGTGNLSYSTFPTFGNYGGVLTGKKGTAVPQLWNLAVGGSNPAMVNICEAYSSVPDSKPWTSLPQTVTSVTDDGTAMLFHCPAHGLQNNHRVGFYALSTASATGTFPPGLADQTVYWVILPKSAPNDNFYLCPTPFTDNDDDPLPFVSAGTGTLIFYSLSTRPVIQNHGNQGNLMLMDAYLGIKRFGALMPNTAHGHTLVEINEDDDYNPDYDVEIGDRAGGRAAYYGFHEFQNVLMYRDDAFSVITTGSGQSKDVPPEPFHLFTTSGGGIATYEVLLPVDLDASYEWSIEFSGGPITTLTWDIYGQSGTTGSINTSYIPLPASSPGLMTVRGFYRRATNDHRITSVTAGSAGMPMGRTGGGAVELGVIGERKHNFVPAASAVALTSTTPAITNSITLPAGSWRIWATAAFNVISGTVAPTEMQWALNISTAGAALPGTKDESYGGRQMAVFTANAVYATERCYMDVNISATTTYNVVQECTYTGGGSAGGSGAITATRRG